MKSLILQNTVIFGLATALAFGCAKTRNAELPEEQRNGTFEISEIQGATMDINILGSAGLRLNSAAEKMTGSGLSEKVTLDESSAPEKFQFLFKNAEAYNLGTSQVKILIGLDRSNLTAYQVASSQQLANQAEASIALSLEEIQARHVIGKSASPSQELRQVEGLKIARERSALQSQTIYIPLFKIALKGSGIVQRKKNDLKEETSVLELKGTDWDRATHIQVSDFVKDRTDINIDESIAAEFNSLISAQSLVEKNSSVDQLNAMLRLSGDLSLKLNKDAVYFSRLGASQLEVYEYVILTEALAADFNKNGSATALSCPEKLSQDLKAQSLTCVLVKRADVILAGKRLQLDSAKGIDAATVSLKDVSDLNQAQKISVKEIKLSSTDSFGVSEEAAKTNNAALRTLLLK